MRYSSAATSPFALLLAVVAAAPLASRAQNIDKPAAPPAGSANFCLHELPGKDGTSRFINLGIVQYVELNRERVRLTYGGGKFGSGYDYDIAVKNRDEGLELIRRIQTTARDCARAPGSAPPTGSSTRSAPSAAGNSPDGAQAPSNPR